MKITSIHATAVSIPFDAPYLWSVGAYTGITRVIIQVETDMGITGYGEAPSWECETHINNHMGPRLIGADPIDIEACELLCVPESKVLSNTDGNTPLKSFGGIEIALWDIRGKTWNVPLYKLLGGAVRKEIPMTEYFSTRPKKGQAGGEKSPLQIAAYCAQMQELHGSSMFEGKCSTGDVKFDIQVVKEVRSAIGDDAMIRLDGNMAWSLSSMKELLKGIEPYNIRNFEDPVATLWEMQKLRQHTEIPFSTHNIDLPLAVRIGVPDAIVLNLTSLGGISKTLKFINACEAMGIDFWFYSGDTGVASAAYLHVSAACRHIHEPSQSLFRFQPEDVIVNGPFKLYNGTVTVPEGPGLGIELDSKLLKTCHERFIKEGPMDQYYNQDNPGTYIRLPKV